MKVNLARLLTDHGKVDFILRAFEAHIVRLDINVIICGKSLF